MPHHLTVGRTVLGISDEQYRHLLSDPLPEDVYTQADMVLVEYSRTLACRESISDDLYERLAQHFSSEQIMVICFLVGMQGMITYFNRTFLVEQDEKYLQANEEAYGEDGPPVAYPPLP